MLASGVCVGEAGSGDVHARFVTVASCFVKYIIAGDVASKAAPIKLQYVFMFPTFKSSNSYRCHGIHILDALTNPEILAH